jgi:hypothetical protein
MQKVNQLKLEWHFILPSITLSLLVIKFLVIFIYEDVRFFVKFYKTWSKCRVHITDSVHVRLLTFLFSDFPDLSDSEPPGKCGHKTWSSSS